MELKKISVFSGFLLLSLVFNYSIFRYNTDGVLTNGNNSNVVLENDYYINNNKFDKKVFNLSTSYLTNDDLYHLNKNELRLLRNEIFARKGYIFSSQEMRDYFSQFDWYVPRYKNVYNQLNNVEKFNIDKIKEHEN